MKKLSFSLVVVLVLAILCSYSFADNGAPSGAHYNLNIIGVQKDKTADMTDQNGHVIFVALDGKTKIKLTEGDTFAVLDKNGTDSDGATFQLPNPDPDNSGTTEYSVFIRALGKPGGIAEIIPGAYYFDGETWIEAFSEITVTAERKPGKSTFVNVSRELLYVYIDLDQDGRAERYPLFDDAMQDYFWDYDNNGLKHLQMRFYEIPTTDVPDYADEF